jgi:hypothetical protein
VQSREKWEVRDHAQLDPVPFADRVEQARREHAATTEQSVGE